VREGCCCFGGRCCFHLVLLLLVAPLPEQKWCASYRNQRPRERFLRGGIGGGSCCWLILVLLFVYRTPTDVRLLEMFLFLVTCGCSRLLIMGAAKNAGPWGWCGYGPGMLVLLLPLMLARLLTADEIAHYWDRWFLSWLYVGLIPVTNSFVFRLFICRNTLKFSFVVIHLIVMLFVRVVCIQNFIFFWFVYMVSHEREWSLGLSSLSYSRLEVAQVHS
jgi:hypothetical protein